MNGLKRILGYRSTTHRPCLILAVLFALGIVLGRYAPIDWRVWAVFIVVLFAASVFILRGRRRWLYAVLVCAGALSYQNSYLLPEDHIAWLGIAQHTRVTAVVGVVDSDVYFRSAGFNGQKQVFEMKIDALCLDGAWRPAQGRVLVHVFAPQRLRYAQHLYLEGRLYRAVEELQGRFRYRQYLEEQGIFFNFSVTSKARITVISQKRGEMIRDLAISLRHRCRDVFKRFLSPLEAGVIQAMIVGDRSLMDRGVYALFQNTGTAHILAISGMNMAIITAMVLFILKLTMLARRAQLAAAGLFLLFYALLSGWSFSVVRAVLMAVVFLASYLFEDQADGLNSLGLAAFILFLLFPGTLFDTGFQLSVLCVGGILAVYPLMAPLIEGVAQAWLRAVLGAGAVSMIAWVMALPIIAWRFEMITPVALLANIPVVVLADLTVCLGLVLALAGICLPFLAWAVAGSLALVFQLMLAVTSFFAAVPLGSMTLKGVEFFHVFCYYSILIIVYLGVKKSVSSNHQIKRKTV